jgi:hypothetical protein
MRCSSPRNYHHDIIVACFGIRRGSGEQGHGHIPGQLHLGPHETKRLAECSLSTDEWIEKMREKGLL